MGFAKTVVNLQDNKPYVISTTKNPLGIWEVAVFHRGLLGRPGKPVCCVCPITPDQMLRLDPYDMIMPEQRLGKRILFFPVKTISVADVEEIHALVADIVMESPANEWEGIFAKAVGRYLDDHQLSDKAKQVSGSTEGASSEETLMGRSGRKDEVHVGGRRIDIPNELVAFRDLTRYFREKGWSPGDAMYLTAWVCGFMAGSVLGAGNLNVESEKAQKLTGQIHQAVAEGTKAGVESQDPKLVQEFLAAGGHNESPSR